MTPEQFLQIADLYPDPSLLLTRDGVIVAVNRSAATLDVIPKDVIGRPLSDLSATPAQTIQTYLQQCSHSQEPVAVAIKLRGSEQEPAFQCYGAIAPGDPQAGEARILLRLTCPDVAPGQLTALSQQVDQLTEEIRRRQQAEARLREIADQHRAMEEHLSALVDASATLTGILEPSAVSDSILKLAQRLLPADAYAVWRWHKPSGRWQITASYGLSAEYQQSTIIVLQQTSSMSETPVIADDVSALPMLAERKEAHRAEGIRSMLVVPLRIHGEVCGTLAIYFRQPHHFTDMEVRVATAMANLAAAAIGSADLYGAIQEHRQRLRVTLASIGDAVLSTDVDARVTYLNPVAEALTGWTAADAHGQPLEEVFRIVNEQTQQPVESPVRRVLREGAIVGLANHTVLIARDGTRRPIDDSAAPIQDETRNIVGVVLTFRDNSGRRQAEAALHEEVRTTETLHRTLTALASQLDLHKIVQTVTDEATSLTGAQFGAFFYNVLDARGESYMLYTLSGAPREAFAQFPMPRNTAIFDPTFRGTGSVRLDDVTNDPRYGQNPPYFGKPKGHLPVRSYLAVPVVSHSGEVLGGLFFGHAEVGVFSERAERLAVGIAAQAAIAIDNARLYGQVQDSEQRFRQLAEHINDVFWLEDPTGPRVLYVSSAYEQIWGRTRQSLYESPRSFMEAIVPADRDTVAGILESQRRGEATDSEYRITRPDGSVRWIRDRGFPIKDEKGMVFRVAGIAEDITDRKRAEQDARFLADASAALAGLVDYESTLQKVASLAVPTFADWCSVDMLDEDGSLRRLAVAHVDPSKVELAHELQRRYPPDPNAPTGVWNILRTAQSEMTSEITDELLTSRIQDAELLRIIRELGLRSYMGVPLQVRGRVLGVITFIAAESGRRYDRADLTVAEDLAHRAAVAIENARLYQAVREADRRKDEFLALLGHELRNPLAPLRNALHVLKLAGSDADVAERARGMMERQIEHMVRLVDDLLDVSRIMRGKVELRRQPVELAAIIARAVETAEPVIDAEGHQLSVRVEPEHLRVNGDMVRLAQVVGNLLHNAAKYTDRGGQIWVTATQEGTDAVLRVRDTGIGIPLEMRARLFDMFFQAARRTKDVQSGLGIGLSLVRGIVELHGGTVEAHSAGPGQGSDFLIRLPALTEQEDDQTQPGQSFPGQGTTLAPRRVLIVDDNVDAADSLAMLLRMHGQNVVVAYDGPSALEQAEAAPPAIAFLDLGMPRMDGNQLARAFRSHPTLNTTVLVALTGWGQAEDRQRTKESGFDLHLVKPVEPSALEDLLSRLKRHPT